MEPPPDYRDIISKDWPDVLGAFELIESVDSYPHWEDLGKDKTGSGLSARARWAVLKLERRGRLRPIGLRDVSGRPFWLALPDGVLEALHAVDRLAFRSDVDAVAAGCARETALREEAIDSARLSGAVLESAAAREMLRLAADPLDAGERAAIGCHRALRELPQRSGRSLDRELLCELHRDIVTGLPEASDWAGRFRQGAEEPPAPSERSADYRPPPPAELTRRFEAMADFANGQTPGFFLPPLIRAVLLHFWLCYDRPFVDGNGRTARALFYWFMLRQGYPEIRSLAISPPLLSETGKYARSFLQTETDDNDLTYFVVHQAAVILEAVRRWLDRLRKKTEALDGAARKWRGLAALNPRQRMLVEHALRHPDTVYVISGHQHSHDVTHQTARDDLFDLVDRGLLTVTRNRRIYHFRGAPEFPARLHSESRRRREPRRPAPEDDALPTSLL